MINVTFPMGLCFSCPINLLLLLENAAVLPTELKLKSLVKFSTHFPQALFFFSPNVQATKKSNGRKGIGFLFLFFGGFFLSFPNRE